MKIINDLLDLPFKIEEKRLIFGKKFEDFLLKTVSQIVKKISFLLRSEFYGIASCVLIILLSLYKRSLIDIGQDSGAYLDITQKILNKKQYYYDFFEYNFPTTFLFLTLPVYIANLFKVSPIVIADYFINLLAVFSLFYSYIILKKSQKFNTQLELNILMICFTWGFFLRVNTLVFNEFLTKTSVILILTFPIISYQIYGVEKLKILQKISLGILYAILIAVKPNLILLPALFEIYRIYKTKNFKSIFELHCLVTAGFLSGYAIFICHYFPSFVENFWYMIALYRDYKSNLSYGNEAGIMFLTFLRLSSFEFINFASYIFLTYIYLRLIKISEWFKYLLLLGMGSILLVQTENYYIDQLAVFYCLFLPLIICGFWYFLKQNKVNLIKSWLIYSSLTIFIFISKDFTALALVFFLKLFPFIAILAIIFLKFEVIAFSKKDKLLAILFLIFFSILSFFSLRYKDFNYDFIHTILSFAIIFIIFRIAIKGYKIDKKCYEFINIFVVIATLGFLGFYFRTTFPSFSEYKELKSPNSTNQELVKIQKNYLKENQKIIIIGSQIFNTYPFKNYSGVVSDSEFSEYQILMTPVVIPEKHKPNQRFDNKALTSILRQMQNQENKLIISFNSHGFGAADCSIGYVEYLLRKDNKIREYFVDNFKYVTSYSLFYKGDIFNDTVKGDLTDAEFNIINQVRGSKQEVINKHSVFEVYVRK